MVLFEICTQENKWEEGVVVEDREGRKKRLEESPQNKYAEGEGQDMYDTTTTRGRTQRTAHGSGVRSEKHFNSRKIPRRK